MARVHAFFIEGYIGDRRTLRRVPIDRSPFRIGRQADLALTLDSSGISRLHADIIRDDKRLMVRDLGSTNGTYVNRRRLVGTREIQDGDIIHFADMEFRVVLQTVEVSRELFRTRNGIEGLSEDLPAGTRQFQQLLLDSEVLAMFQPIVNMDSGAIHGYEVLARGTHPKLPDKPSELFRIAESLDLEAHLSELMRRCGVITAAKTNAETRFFLNVHPVELQDPTRMLLTIGQLRAQFPEMKLAVEFHEGAVADLNTMRDIHDRLRSLDIKVAYDDFGAGQARLVELTEAQPDYIKLDITLVQDLDKATDAKRQMIKLLADFATSLNVKVVAEGVSRPAEAEVCVDLGIQYCQGYLFGRPHPEVDAHGRLDVSAITNV